MRYTEGRPEHHDRPRCSIRPPARTHRSTAAGTSSSIPSRPAPATSSATRTRAASTSASDPRRRAGPPSTTSSAHPRCEVPGDWNTQREDLLWYEGTLWYWRKTAAAARTASATSCTSAAPTTHRGLAERRTRLGEHRRRLHALRVRDHGAAAPATATSSSRASRTQRRRDRVPTLDSDWWNYGGLTREVYVVKRHATFVRDWFVRLDATKTHRVHGTSTVDGAAPEHRGRGRSRRQQGTITVDATGRATHRAPATAAAGRRSTPCCTR